MEIVTGARTDGNAQLPVVAALVRPGSKYKTNENGEKGWSIDTMGAQMMDSCRLWSRAWAGSQGRSKKVKEKKTRKIRGQER